MSLTATIHPLPKAAAQADPRPAMADDPGVARVPRVTIHAFHETADFAATWRLAAQDRRLVSATTDLRPGGFAAALRCYANERTPDLIIVESLADSARLEFHLDSLADLCDPATRVIVVGHRNEIQLYRKLIGMGVSSYLVAPVDIAAMISAISDVYSQSGAEKIGRVTAVIGAKGGVGSSTLAQSLALALSERQASDVLLADLDLAFGTAALNLDVEPNQGLAELIDRAEPIDAAMLDRVTIRRGLRLTLLCTSPGLEAGREIDEDAVERIIEVAQMHLRHSVLDLPHLWSPWVERALAAADHVIVVATPELGSLKNAVAVLARARALRPNDPAPLLVLNQVGMPHRQEVTARDIAQVLKVEPALSVPFDAKAFSLAAARGRMVAEVARRKPVARAYAKLAAIIDPDAPRPHRGPLSLLRRGRRRAA